MTASGCDLLFGTVLRHRRKLCVILVLFMLQGLLLIYSASSSPSECHGSDCPASANASRPLGSRLRRLLLGPAPPPPSQPKTAAPSSWTRLRPSSWQELVPALMDYIEKPHARCEKAVRIGGQPDYKNRKFDGYKWVCLDPALGLLGTNSCLIYSFGVDHDWSFDDNVQRLQCEIHAFDPSIGRKDHKRSPLISFHDLGIGGRNEMRTVRGARWDIRTYGNIVSLLGHQSRTVHYLKVDVEGAEWDMFAQVFAETPQLLRNVRQIGMEVHMAYGQKSNGGLDRWKGYLSVFQKLEAMGFRLFHSEMNPYTRPEALFPTVSRRASRVYEMVWIYQP